MKMHRPASYQYRSPNPHVKGCGLDGIECARLPPAFLMPTQPLVSLALQRHVTQTPFGTSRATAQYVPLLSCAIAPALQTAQAADQVYPLTMPEFLGQLS